MITHQTRCSRSKSSPGGTEYLIADGDGIFLKDSRITDVGRGDEILDMEKE
jgi:hypothetical protein